MCGNTPLDLPARYLFSAFWEGQEGSSALDVLNAVLGFILTLVQSLLKDPGWSLCGCKGFLVSMVLGVYIGDMHIGYSPFILVRELQDNGLCYGRNSPITNSIPKFRRRIRIKSVTRIIDDYTSSNAFPWLCLLPWSHLMR